MKRSHEVRFLVGAAVPEQFPRLSLPEVAFLGRSNVGKSSLLNCLVGRAIARVSKTPGRTQQINFFLIDHRFVFADLPGYGFARVPLAIRQRWATLIEQYLESRRQLRVVVLLVDLRRGLQREELGLIRRFSRLGVRYVIVATKADRVSQSERARQTRALKGQLAALGIDPIVSSTVTGEGVGAVWRVILRHCEPAADCTHTGDG